MCRLKDGQLKASDFAPKKCPPGQHPADSRTCVKDEPLKASDLSPRMPSRSALGRGEGLRQELISGSGKL